MVIKHAARRLAAAAAATTIVVVGAGAPAFADDGDNDSTQGTTTAPQHTAQGPKDGKGDTEGDQGDKGDKGDGSKSTGNSGQGKGQGHHPVTVCHRLGNGGYHLLTFDRHALDAHLHHGDIYPVPADGCPTADESTAPAPGNPTTPPVEDGSETDTTGTTGTVPGSQPTVLGTEAVRTAGLAPRAPKVLGVQAVRGADGKTAAVGPLAGILPQTGAGRMLLPLTAGLGLLATGGVVLARRRRVAGR